MIRKGPKRTISTSGGLGLLQMVSEPYTSGVGCLISKGVISDPTLERGTTHFLSGRENLSRS